MKNNTNLYKISNIYNLKSIFSYLSPETMLKIIKNNKELQNKLGINLNDYKNLSNFLKYEFISKIETIDKRTSIFNPGAKENMRICMLSCTTCIHFLYVLIYSILLIALDFFDENKTNNNNEDYFNKIKIINKIKQINRCLFIFVLSIIISYIIQIKYFKKSINLEYGNIKIIIKSMIIVLINLIYIIFEGLIIWKLVLLYEVSSEVNNIVHLGLYFYFS